MARGMGPLSSLRHLNNAGFWDAWRHLEDACFLHGFFLMGVFLDGRRYLEDADFLNTWRTIRLANIDDGISVPVLQGVALRGYLGI